MRERSASRKTGVQLLRESHRQCLRKAIAQDAILRKYFPTVQALIPGVRETAYRYAAYVLDLPNAAGDSFLGAGLRAAVERLEQRGLALFSLLNHQDGYRAFVAALLDHSEGLLFMSVSTDKATWDPLDGPVQAWRQLHEGRIKVTRDEAKRENESIATLRGKLLSHLVARVDIARLGPSNLIASAAR